MNQTMFRLFAFLFIATLSFSSISKDLNQLAWHQAISAIGKGDHNKLEEIITSAPEIVKYYSSGKNYSLINYAVLQDQHHANTKKALLSVLKEHGAPFESNVANGMTPLNRLLESYGEDHEVAHIAELLILYGPKAVNIESNDGVLPIFGRYREKTARVLVEAGADVNARSPTGLTPLIWNTYQGNYKAVKLLLENGANINAQDNDGNTVLHYATKLDGYDDDSPENGTRRARIVKTLLEYGAQVNVTNKKGVTPLMEAAYRSRLGVVRLLLEHDADSKAIDSTGLTALHYFAKSDAWVNFDIFYVSYPGDDEGGNLFIKYYKAIANELIQKGADLKAKSNSGETALNIAEKNRKSDIFSAFTQIASENKAG